MLKGFVSGEEKDIVRIPMKVGNEYKEGWEVRDNQDRLIWGREDELQTVTGTLPFKGYALPVKVKSLLGNAVQNGTPSPQNIVTPEMCGVRTGNLFDISTATDGVFIRAGATTAQKPLGNIENNQEYVTSDYIPVTSGNTYTVKYLDSTRVSGAGLVYFSDNEGTAMSGVPLIEQFGADAVPKYTFTVPSGCKYIRFSYHKNSSATDTGVMLNLGSTALPYEPYGWKVPFENRGENLFDSSVVTAGSYISDSNGNVVYSGGSLSSSDYIDISGAVYVSITAQGGNEWGAFYNAEKTFISGISGYTNGMQVPDNAKYMRLTVKASAFDSFMVNVGSTPKPYSPYLNATIPVYLGEVPTVRRVRKLVLTGTEEGWEKSATRAGCFALRGIGIGITEKSMYCTHATYVSTATELASNNTCYIGNDFNIWFDLFDAQTTVEQFKTYLASEYAAGHPVTIWYVLATPETTISNEPLCKISTYADELTTIQAHGLSAPLYGIGDYKDTLNLSTGVVTRKVKKLVLTGQEQWSLWSSGQPDVERYYYKWGKSAPSGSGLICTHLPYRNTDGNFEHIRPGGSSRDDFVIYISKTIAPTVTDFKAYLTAQYQAGTPVTAWYVLSTPTTETVTVPTGMTGEIEGYLTQVSTPSPTNRSVPKWNGVEETGGTYAVTVYAPPEIPTTTGQNTLTVDSNLAPSKLEVSIHAKKIHYGFKIDKSNDDSDSAVIYTHDAVTMTPAHMDFTNDRFDYGSWGNAFFVRDCYPVALNLDGTIAYRLDPDDYTKKTDGTASDIFYELLTAAPSDWSTQWKQYYTKDANDNYELNSQSTAPTFATDTYYKLTYNSAFTGNFMMAFPKVWFYRHEDSQYNYIEISNYKLSDDWKCYAHINASGREVDFIYLPLFKGVIVNSKLRSLPGQIPQGNTTATDEVNAATALGSRWQIWDHSSVELINDLLTLMSKSIDSQGRFGKGRESGYNSSDTVTYGKLQTGTLIKGGKFHGFSSSYKEVKVFGLEGFWANRWDRLQGMLLVNNVWKIKMTPPYNFTGTDFVTLSNASVPTGNGYLSKVQTSEYGSIPASIDGGSSTKYFKDYFYKTATDTRVALRGGGCSSGAGCGFRYVNVDYTASPSRWYIGASPLYK